MNRRAIIFVLASLTFASAACDNGDEGIYLMRVDNQRDQAVEFRFGDVNYGSIGANTITAYVEVDPGPHDVIADDQVIHSDVELGQNLIGENFWTYTVQDQGNGLSADDPPLRNLTDQHEETDAEALDSAY